MPHSFPALLRAMKYAKKIRLAGEDICLNERDFTGDERRMVSAGRELYDMCRKMEAAGINPEEALAFYVSGLTKEAEIRGL